MRRSSGLTLIETLVCMALFATMLAAVVICERTLRNAQPHSAQQSDVDRLALVAFEKIRSQLRGALIVPDGQTSMLSFYLPERTATGDLQLTSSGEPAYQTRVSSLHSDAGQLLNSDSQPVASLGENGWVSFQLEDSLDVLSVTVHAQAKDFQRELQGRIALTNQN